MVPALFANSIIFLVLSIVFIGLRFYCKRLKHAKLFIDDYVLVASWVCHHQSATFLSQYWSNRTNILYFQGLHSRLCGRDVLDDKVWAGIS